MPCIIQSVRRIHRSGIQHEAGATSPERSLLMDCILTQRQNPKQFAALLQEQRRGFTNTAQIMGMATVAAHKRQALQQVFCSPDALIRTNQQGWKRSMGINQQNAKAIGVIGLRQIVRHGYLLDEVFTLPACLHTDKKVAAARGCARPV